MKNHKRKKEKKLLDDCLKRDFCEGIVKEYGNLIYHTVLKTLIYYNIDHNIMDIEDLQMETIIQIWLNDRRRLRQYNPDKGLSLAGWIKLIAANTTRNILRKNKLLDLGNNKSKVDLDEIQTVIGYDEEKRYDAREKLMIIKECLDKLKLRENLVLQMYFLYGQGENQIAFVIRKSVPTTRQILRRAKKRLIAMVNKKLSED